MSSENKISINAHKKFVILSFPYYFHVWNRELMGTRLKFVLKFQCNIKPNLVPKLYLLCLPWSLQERPWLGLVT